MIQLADVSYVWLVRPCLNHAWSVPELCFLIRSDYGGFAFSTRSVRPHLCTREAIMPTLLRARIKTLFLLLLSPRCDRKIASFAIESDYDNDYFAVWRCFAHYVRQLLAGCQIDFESRRKLTWQFDDPRAVGMHLLTASTNSKCIIFSTISSPTLDYHYAKITANI